MAPHVGPPKAVGVVRLARLGVLLVIAWLVPMESARATFHLMLVVEVFPGHPSSPNAQYVELQMYSPGQNLVAGHAVEIFDAAGGLVGTFTFPGNVPNGADQASILIATAEAQALFGVTADLPMTPVIAASGGKVCFAGTIDCVAWGNYTGSPVGVGGPFRPGGLSLGRAAQRRLDRGSPGRLDPADDTGDSAADFVTAVPTPRSNANVAGPSLRFFTVTPCRTVDTRVAGGALVAGADRTFTIAGTCGIPDTAQAVSLNVTVTQPTAPGNVRLFPAGDGVPFTSTINYATGQTRANNAMAGLGVDGRVTARCEPSGSTHLILDVNGYLQ